MSTTVLVPLDGSLMAERALPVAMSLVRQRDGRLELVFVHRTTPLGGLPDAPWHAMSESMEDRYLTDKARQLGLARGAEVGRALVRGETAAKICERARAVGADLIVMATHGRTGWSRVVSGSIADAVIRESGQPVLLLRAPPPVAAGRGPAPEFRRILVALDGSAEARRIFDAVAAVARPGVTELVLVHVVPPVHEVVEASVPYAIGMGPVDTDATQQLVGLAEHELADAGAELARRSGCEVDAHVVVAEHPAPAIIDVARKREVDLIAMTTRGRGGSRVLFGSVVDAVVRESELPMLVQRPADH